MLQSLKKRVMNKYTFTLCFTTLLLSCSQTESNIENPNNIIENIINNKPIKENIKAKKPLLTEDTTIQNNPVIDQSLLPEMVDLIITDYPFDIVEAYISDSSKLPTNVRATPSGDIITKLAHGEDYMLKIVDKKGRWFKVEYINTPEASIALPNNEGWIHGSVIGFETRNYGGEKIDIRSHPKRGVIHSFSDLKQVKLVDYMDYEEIIYFAKIEYFDHGEKLIGWVDIDNLCGNPLTTCP